uniref:Uncharacterized protein n=1 Tax=Candidatus Giovannonibacteria bacterium GW2011_GWF2_42_19 TaxID=1618659 RepID=A0A0G0ZIG6_9BACT|nr:MAG: hypothetical protein UV11_C0007G0003 [Candidatus Giovannonibacteria bacterium GW2011_GWF2_42_19]
MSRFQNKILFAGLYVEMFLQFFVWLDRRLNVKYVVRNIEEIYYEVYFVFARIGEYKNAFLKFKKTELF